MEVQKMNPEVKALWLAALRSGEYPQTSRALRDGYGFCCLGVLCDIHTKTTGNGMWSVGGSYSANNHTRGEIPPPAVVTWAGLNRPNPDVVKEETQYDTIIYRSLAELNDRGATFEEIADIIEEVL